MPGSTPKEGHTKPCVLGMQNAYFNASPLASSRKASIIECSVHSAGGAKCAEMPIK